MKAFASQVCFGVCLLMVGCGGDDDAPVSASSGGAGGTSASAGGAGGTNASGGSGGEAGGAAGAAGAGEECESPRTENELEIAGAFGDGYDIAHRIDDSVWQMATSTFDVIDFSNEERWLVAENSADNEFFSASYSRFEWTWDDGQLYYCQSVFAASSEAEAREAPRADASDLLAGCGGTFPWGLLTPIALAGSYVDDFAGKHLITPSVWKMGSSVFHLLEFSNDATWAVAQNDCDNAYSAGKYSRFDWLVLQGGEGGAAGAAGAGAGGAGGASSKVYYCQTGYDEASAEAARQLKPADSADLTNGCSGFAWSELTPED